MSDMVYLVRGAKLNCIYGSHIRKLNLPKCHGVYATGHPMVHELDCKSKENISSFGVCSSPMVSAMNPSPPEVVLKKVKYDENLNPVETGELVKGPMCIPMILQEKWQNTYDITRIVDNGNKDPGDKGKDKDSEEKGYPAVTTSSFATCYCGGKISPVTSGQEQRR